MQYQLSDCDNCHINIVVHTSIWVVAVSNAAIRTILTTARKGGGFVVNDVLFYICLKDAFLVHCCIYVNCRATADI